jgi:transcriptional regulator with XRE-family HTH domain
MLADRLRSLRKQKNLTQAECASLLRIAPTTYASYEQGRRTPDVETLSQLADVFATTTDYLLGRTSDPSPPRNAASFDPEANDWYEHAPQWLKELYDDPDYRQYLKRSDVRRILLSRETRQSYAAGASPPKAVGLDIIKYIAWRLDQQREEQANERK